MDLEGKTAIVTGGSGGLGARICHALADAGSNVAVVYNSDRQGGERHAAELRDKGVRADIFQCDVTDPEQVESLVTQVVDTFGSVDILINNAGYNKWIAYDDLDALTFEEWNKIIDINLNGPMHCMKAVAATMKRQGAGQIVNVSSVAGLGPTGSSIPYAVAKAALIHLTKCMAVALGPEVVVNAVAPGAFEGTGMSANLSDEYKETARQGAALKHMADKDDIALQMVAFCRTGSITGQTVVIDSGRVFH